MSRNDWHKNKPLVLDTNTVLSGLIGGTTRQLLFELDRDLRYPEPSFAEIQRNRGVIQERAGLSATATDELIDGLFDGIVFVPETDVLMHYQTAAKAMSPHPDADHERQFKDRDQDDVVFLATALATDGDIWSDDSVFRHQDHANWYRTKEIIEQSRVDL